MEAENLVTGLAVVVIALVLLRLLPLPLLRICYQAGGHCEVEKFTAMSTAK